MSRARGYCFTVNNYTESDVLSVQALCRQATYGIYGLEQGVKCMTPHIQGYVYYNNKISFNSIKSVLPKAHIEAALGCAADNRAYCSKDGNYIEYGSLPQQGKRNDIEDFRDAILEGASEEDLIMNYPIMMAKYDRFYQRCRNLVLQKEAKKNIQPEVTVLIGEPGTGKTRTIYDTEDINNVYKMECGDGSDKSIFWDAYNGQEVILIDDFHNNFRLDYMLRLLDRYPMKLNIKGGHTWKCAKRIYITSNLHPNTWYRNCPEIHRKALFRRLTNIIMQHQQES